MGRSPNGDQRCVLADPVRPAMAGRATGLRTLEDRLQPASPLVRRRDLGRGPQRAAPRCRRGRGPRVDGRGRRRGGPRRSPWLFDSPTLGARPRAELAGAVRPVQRSQGRRDPGAPPRGRRTSTTQSTSRADVGRPGVPQRPGQAAAHPTVPTALVSPRTLLRWHAHLVAPVRGPRANAIAERWIGTLRRECLDHLLIIGSRHLLMVLQEYLEHYNTQRPHRSLGQHPPVGRTPPGSGATIRPLRRDRLGGLMHECVQVA